MPNLAALSKVCRPVVMELLAHGRSPSPEDAAAYHPDSYVRAFEQIRTELGVDRWFVCGQSFGASLTLRYALEHPTRIAAQAFTNSNSALADAETVRQYRENSESRARGVEQGGHDFIAEMPIHPSRARRLPEPVRDALVRDTELLNPRGLALTFRHSSPFVSVRDRVGENTVPTVLVCGERETRFTASREFAEAAMPGLTVVAADAGHAVNIQAADVFNDAIVGLIQQHGDRSR